MNQQKPETELSIYERSVAYDGDDSLYALEADYYDEQPWKSDMSEFAKPDKPVKLYLLKKYNGHREVYYMFGKVYLTESLEEEISLEDVQLNTLGQHNLERAVSVRAL